MVLWFSAQLVVTRGTTVSPTAEGNRTRFVGLRLGVSAVLEALPAPLRLFWQAASSTKNAAQRALLQSSAAGLDGL